MSEILMTLAACQKRLKEHCCGAPMLRILTPLEIRTLISSRYIDEGNFGLHSHLVHFQRPYMLNRYLGHRDKINTRLALNNVHKKLVEPIHRLAGIQY